MLRGFALAPPLTSDEVAQTNEWLLSRPIYHDAHVPQTARNENRTPWARSFPSRSECVCVHTDDAIVAPHIFDRALLLTRIAGVYLGREWPRLYSANAFWTRPGRAAIRPDIQEFHEDKDDVKFLAMFVFLTDVLTPEDGCQQLIGPDGQVREIMGPAGTIFLADTSRPHRGLKPKTHERGLFWFRWGVSDKPPAGQWDKIEPIPAARLGDRYPKFGPLQQAISLLVSPP